MNTEELREVIRTKFETLKPLLNERASRIWAATEARAWGRGGITNVAKATGIGRRTIWIGLEEIGEDEHVLEQEERVRQIGAGRKPLTETDQTLMKDLDFLVDPTTRGDPCSPLRWTCKSFSVLAKALKEMGHKVSPRKVGYLLKEMNFSLQGMRKTREGSQHPDRNAQFEYINETSLAVMGRGQPVISVDTKKKELIGEFKNNGSEWEPKGFPEEGNTHDFPSQSRGKAIPYGIYDIFDNSGWVSVGISHDTAEFAVASIKRWWKEMGSVLYPDARELLIIADSGGSNSARGRLWKFELQRLSNELGIDIHVCHFPPGTSKWNKIEHRMFCHITRNWRGRSLTSYETVVNLIANTKTEKGLEIEAALDEGTYELGIGITKTEFASINLVRDEFHGDWNYAILPRSKSVD